MATFAEMSARFWSADRQTDTAVSIIDLPAQMGVSIPPNVQYSTPSIRIA